MPRRLLPALLSALLCSVFMAASTAEASNNRTARTLIAPKGQTLGRPHGISPSDSPAIAAQAFFKQNSRLNPKGDVFQVDQNLAAQGHRRVRLVESHQGIPVMGGESVIVLDNKNRVLGASSESLPGEPPSDLTADITSTRAKQFAVKAMGKTEVPVKAQTAKLMIFDPRIFGAEGPQVARLVWQVEIKGYQYRHLVLIDANSGVLVLDLNQNHQAKYRKVCDAANGELAQACSDIVSPARSEGSSATGIQDVDNAYDLSGGVYDFYHDRFGRDSIDGSGMTLMSIARWCGGGCPYENAFWDGTEMVYGPGFASADDVVAHELTHGVTERTSQLVYYYQSGAINEAMSDIMGELFDLSNSFGTDTTEKRWKMGEDLPPSVGVIRDMANPPAYGQPDKMTSYYYMVGPWDYGGVHYNSGVANKAAYLLVDGGSFNGQNIQGIGLDKTAKLFYQTNTQYLRSGSDYGDLARALQAACSAGVGSDYTLEECQQVDQAIAATEMNQSAPDETPDLAICPMNGDNPSTVFHDDFSSLSNWSKNDLLSPSVTDWYMSSYGRDNRSAYIPASKGNSDQTLETNTAIRIPAHAAFRLRHAYAFAYANATNGYTGAVVEYSTNGGSSWQDIANLPSVNAANGYRGNIIAPGSNLYNRSAFITDSRGMSDSMWSLDSLQGEDVKFRLRLASDATYNSSIGWYIDDVSVYSCSPDITPPETTIQSQDYIVNNSTMRFSFVANEAASFECSLDDAAWASCSSPKTYQVMTEGNHVFRVRAIDLAGQVDPTPAQATTIADWTPPVTSIVKAPYPSGKRSIKLQVSVNEAVSQMSCNIDQTGWKDCGSSISGSPLSRMIDTGYLQSGLHVIQIRTTDTASNLEDPGLIVPFLIDTTPPRLTIKGSAKTRTTRPWFQFISNEKVTIKCQLDRNRATPCSSRWRPVRSLKRGKHSISISATDSNGNTSSKRFYFKIVR